MITIQKIRTEPYGLFLDYENCPCGVAVNRQTGNVYLNDAPWHSDQAGGAVGMIECNQVLNFQAHPTKSGTSILELHCLFGSETQETVFELGETLNVHELEVWLRIVNAFYLSRDSASAEAHSDPEAREVGDAASFAGRVDTRNEGSTSNSGLYSLDTLRKSEIEADRRHRATG